MTTIKRTLLVTAFVIPALCVGYLYFSRARSAANGMILHSVAASWSANERRIPKIQSMLKEEPDSAEWNAALGQAYLQKARETGDPAYYTKAEGLFERSLSSKSDYSEAQMGLASLAMSRHEFSKARDLATDVIQKNPDTVSTYGILTDADVELGDYDAAIRTLDKMVRMKPNLSSYSRISYLRELNGDIEGAVHAMQMAIDSGAPDAENTAWCMVQLGNLYSNSGRPADANREYRQALDRFPNYVHALAGLARVSVAQKDFGAAVHYYEAAIERVPLPEFVIGLGEVYERMGKATEAKSEFDLVDAIQQIYRSNGVSVDTEMALFNADRGVDLDKAVSLARGEWNKRKSVRVADVYAWTLYRSGRYDEADSIMKQALRLGTKDPLLLFHAGMIARARNDSQGARQYLSNALSLNPGFSATHAFEASSILTKL